jgi:hypothetical protein
MISLLALTFYSWFDLLAKQLYILNHERYNYTDEKGNNCVGIDTGLVSVAAFACICAVYVT